MLPFLKPSPLMILWCANTVRVATSRSPLSYYWVLLLSRWIALEICFRTAQNPFYCSLRQSICCKNLFTGETLKSGRSIVGYVKLDKSRRRRILEHWNIRQHKQQALYYFSWWVLQLHAVEYIQSTPCLGVRVPRGLICLDAVLPFGFLAWGEGQPGIAIGYVLFLEPKWVMFQFGSKFVV